MKYWIGLLILLNVTTGYFLVVQKPIYVTKTKHSKETIYKYEQIQVPVYIQAECTPITITREIIKECDVTPTEKTEVQQTTTKTTEGRIFKIKERDEHRFIVYGATGRGVLDKTLKEDGDGYVNTAKYGLVNEAQIMYSPKGTNLWFGVGATTNKNQTIGVGYEWGF